MSKLYATSIEERFKQQARQARQRGIDWQMTFGEWHQMWLDSGKLPLRGKGAGKFVMARRGDVGPYSAANCFICSFEQNVRDGRTWDVKGAGKNRRIDARGWTYIAKVGRYQVMAGRRYIGRFLTQQEAEAAYRAAIGLAERS